jgi:hypothetical protein
VSTSGIFKLAQALDLELQIRDREQLLTVEDVSSILDLISQGLCSLMSINLGVRVKEGVDVLDLMNLDAIPLRLLEFNDSRSPKLTSNRKVFKDREVLIKKMKDFFDLDSTLLSIIHDMAALSNFFP